MHTIISVARQQDRFVQAPVQEGDWMTLPRNLDVLRTGYKLP